MFSGFCQKCCQKTYGIAFRRWSGQFHEINYNHYAPFTLSPAGTSYSEPILQDDGSRQWLSIDVGTSPITPTIMLGTRTFPGFDDTRMRLIKVRTEHDQTHARCLLRLENVHNFIDIVYQKPLADMPSYRSVGVHRFTAEDIDDYQYTEKDQPDSTDQVRNGFCGTFVPLARPEFSESDFGEVTLLRKDIINTDNGFMPPGATVSASTTLGDFDVACFDNSPAVFSYSNTPISVQAGSSGTPAFFDPNVFGHRLVLTSNATAFTARRIFYRVPGDNLVSHYVSFQITRILWEAYAENDSIEIALNPNTYMPLPGIYSALVGGLWDTFSDYVGPFSATFTMS